MEPKYINEYEMTYELYKKLNDYNLLINKKKKTDKEKIRNLILCCCGISVIIAGSMLAEFAYIISGLVFLVIALFRLFILFFLKQKMDYRQLCQLVKLEPVPWKYIFADHIILEVGKFSIKYDYTDITGIFENRRFFYLKTEEESIIIQKDCFIVGTENSFREFCRNL